MTLYIRYPTLWLWLALVVALLNALLGKAAAQAPRHETAPLIVATYAYPTLDRQAAVTPLQTWLERHAQRTVIIRIADTPAELAAWAADKQVDLLVPNLATYLKIRQQNTEAQFIAVPRSHSPLIIKSQYRGSIAASGIRSLSELRNQLISGRRLKVFAVFPDSTTGALIGLSKLRASLTESQFRQLQLHYTGSHELVVQQLKQHPFAIGILSANTLSRLNQDRAVTELWRSGEIPFGPVTCVQRQLSCEQLKSALARDPLGSQQILLGLKSGWPKFEHTDSLSFHEHRVYSVLLDEHSGQSNANLAYRPAPATTTQHGGLSITPKAVGAR